MLYSIYPSKVNLMSGCWAKYQQWCLTDIPNCNRAIRMTSLVLSVLLTASVLAWRDKRNFLHLQNLWLVAMLVIKTGKYVSWKKQRQRKEENLTYAQFPISFANIFRGIVLGSSFSFPSINRLRDGNSGGERTRIGHHENKKAARGTDGHSSSVLQWANACSQLYRQKDLGGLKVIG